MMLDRSQPLVCICIPTYNAEKHICKTLTSILNQSYTNLVIHIVDNASSDHTLTIVKSFQEPRIHIHSSDVNIGAEANFTRCIQMAEGDYTAIFHADDIYEPQIIEAQVTFLEENTSAGAVFTKARTIDDCGRIKGIIGLPKSLEKSSGNNLYNFGEIFTATLKHSNFLICPSVMARTSVYKNGVISWRGDLFGSSADLDVWFRILQNNCIGILPECFMKYRISEDQGSAKVRLRTLRADFFRVMEYYLAFDNVQEILTYRDLRNYSWLERRDRVMRSVNNFLLDETEEAGRLSRDLVSLDAVYAALCSRKGIFTLVVGLYVKLLLYLGINRCGKSTLLFMKKRTNR